MVSALQWLSPIGMSQNPDILLKTLLFCQKENKITLYVIPNKHAPQNLVYTIS